MDITSLPPHLSPENSSDARFGENRQRINTLQRELAEVFFLLLKKRRAAVGGKSLPAKTTLKLSLELSQADSPETSSDQLYLQLVRAVDRFMTGSAFPPGHVYCHWCRSFSCEHSVPPDPRSVFGGYTATGQPTWPEFVSVLLDRRHPRIDEIFREDPSPITLVEDGKGLSSEQLPIYGKRSFIYRILGQVVLGYVLYPNGLFLGSSASSRRLPVAITIQAVETMNDAGPLLLNVVGKLPDGASAFQAFEESSDSRLGDALRTTQRRLEEVSLLKGLSRRRRQTEREKRVLGILHHLARNLDRIFRQRQRRTYHSQSRHMDRQRPASSALMDALQARPESIFRDIEERTWVVIGPKNRVHVFNDEALHVTSVVYPGETVRQRTARGRWRVPGAEERSAFQEELRRRLKN